LQSTTLKSSAYCLSPQIHYRQYTAWELIKVENRQNSKKSPIFIFKFLSEYPTQCYKYELHFLARYHI